MDDADAARRWGFPSPATPPGSSAYYAVRFARRALRDDLAALYGLRWMLRRIPVEVSDPGVASAKLNWWREELRRIDAGVPSHPLSQRLAPLVERAQLPANPFVDLGWSTEAVISGYRPKDFAELLGFARQDVGALMELVLRVQGDTEPARIESARTLGTYCSLVHLIRDSGASVRRGQLGIVPTTWLREVGVRADDLARPAGRHLLPRLLAGLAEKARATRARAGNPGGLPVTLRIEVRLADLLLAELQGAGFDLMDQRIALTPIHKLWQAWRESRRRI